MSKQAVRLFSSSALAENVSLLKQWIISRGGEINPKLDVTDCTTKGIRGVVAKEEISLEEAKKGPLISIPPMCWMTSSQAEEQLFEKGLAGLPMMQSNSQLPSQKQSYNRILQLALWLALERQRGSHSDYAPFISLLPATPSCGWAVPKDELKTALQEIGPWTRGWVEIVHKSRQAVEARARDTSERCAALDVQIDAEEMKWAMGHVMSRSLNSFNPQENQDGEIILVPYLDLINHADEAAYPIGKSGAVHVLSSWQSKPRGLQKGDELFVQYSCGQTAVHTYLKMGFVPDKFLPSRTRQ